MRSNQRLSPLSVLLGKAAMARMFLSVMALIVIGGAVMAQTITDGDTIKLDGTIYRM
jgi:hypothetical protein